MRFRSGFTLIEISLALVVIGLLVGGIMVAQGLIEVAKMNRQISQIGSIQLAFSTFKLKYGCLPGDCRNATSLFNASTQPDLVTNGNGNGRIDAILRQSCGPCVDGFIENLFTTTTYESMRAFDHLAASGLFAFATYDESDANVLGVPDRSYPKVAFSSKLIHTPSPNHANVAVTDDPTGVMVGWFSDADYDYTLPAHYIFVGMRENTSNTRLYTDAGFQPWDAQMIDEKMDNGQPLSGRVLAYAADFSYGLTYCTTATSISQGATYRGKANLVSSWGVGVQKTCGLAVVGLF